MMELEYVIAEGPAGLQQALIELEKNLRNQTLANREHYILYRCGDQRSLIKADFSQPPFLLWHYDLSKRPATIPLKNVILQFLNEHANDPLDCFLDVSRKKLLTEQKDFLDGGEMVPFNDMDPTLSNAFFALVDQHRDNFKPDKLRLDVVNFFKSQYGHLGEEAASAAPSLLNKK